MESKVKDILRRIRNEAAAKGIQASFLYHHEKSHLMRIGNNSVSLSTSEELTRLDIEIINGKRQGSHTQLGEVISEEYVREALELAVQKAEVANEKSYQPIFAKIEETVIQEDQYDEALENLDPSFKAEGYKQIFDKIGNHYNFSGSWSSGSTEYFMMTTANENEVYRRGTDQLFNVVLKHPEKRWELSSSQTGYRKSDFCVDATVAEFSKLSEIYEKYEGNYITPGEYTVVLGAQALAEVMEMAIWTGLSGAGYEEKRGWTAGKNFGDVILGENITITDKPDNDLTYKFAFDLFGLKRNEFPLIENGKFSNLIYDSTTAAKYGKQVTSQNVNGTSITMMTGSGAECIKDEVKGMGKVLFIPALHYINLPNPNKGIFTGSSRFNAVLIEDGEVKGPIFSSRITDSFASVFGKVKVISSKMVSVNLSNTYGRRSPVAAAVPSYIVSEKVKITDCAESF
ncbi:MAG: hypothetical protein JXR48_00540 [Candidatus Delongbacteria bacterium]|nr:hypothetical protein [Candidatus Delongbacteria bacterium]MBN2833429.1 hypothetical protein [Candidatus Delongbacteria bacterium]